MRSGNVHNFQEIAIKPFTFFGKRNKKTTSSKEWRQLVKVFRRPGVKMEVNTVLTLPFKKCFSSLENFLFPVQFFIVILSRSPGKAPGNVPDQGRPGLALFRWFGTWIWVTVPPAVPCGEHHTVKHQSDKESFLRLIMSVRKQIRN